MAHMGHPYEWQQSSVKLMGAATQEKAKADQANSLSSKCVLSLSLCARVCARVRVCARDCVRARAVRDLAMGGGYYAVTSGARPACQ